MISNITKSTPDGVYIYDPRYQNMPVLKDDYFRALKEINPDGFDVFTIQ